MDTTAQQIARLARAGDSATLHRALADLLPWASILPPSDMAEFQADLAAADDSAIAVLLTHWRHSAEIHADPQLLAKPTREPEGDCGPVPVPE